MKTINDLQEVVFKQCRYELANNEDCYLRVKAHIVNFDINDAKK